MLMKIPRFDNLFPRKKKNTRRHVLYEHNCRKSFVYSRKPAKKERRNLGTNKSDTLVEKSLQMLVAFHAINLTKEKPSAENMKCVRILVFC